MGEDIVLLSNSEQMYAATQAWMYEPSIFEGTSLAADYAAAVAC